MESIDVKSNLFEYLVVKLDDWRNACGNSNSVITKLYLQKMLFFVVAANATEASHELLDVFNRFYALPYGPVEMDVYEKMKENKFRKIKFEGNVCLIKNRHFVPEENISDKYKAIDAAVSGLRKINKNFVMLTSSELVKISHRWSAWSDAMDVAVFLGKNSMNMTSEEILKSSKFFNK